MRRRKLLIAGGAIILSSIAGCGGGGDEDESDSTPTTEAETEIPVTPEEPEEGGVAYAVNPSTAEIDWGDEYSVEVTVQAGENPPQSVTIIVYKAEGDNQWSSVSGTQSMWRLDEGESQTETYDIQPPAAGPITFGLMDAEDTSVIQEWELTVQSPQVAKGGTVSYYDGLDVKLDVQLVDTIEVTVNDMWGDKIGVYTVRPEDGQWVEVTVTVENTNVNTEVNPPGVGDFEALAGGTQLPQPGGGTVYYQYTDYEVLEDKEFSEGDDFNLSDEDGFFDPPSPMIPESSHEGWFMFTTDVDTTLDEVSIRLVRNKLRATWE